MGPDTSLALYIEDLSGAGLASLQVGMGGGTPGPVIGPLDGVSSTCNEESVVARKVASMLLSSHFG